MFTCATCSKTFSTKGTLNRHEQNHLRGRRFTCSECHVSFRRRDLLSRHIRIHGITGSSVEVAGPRQRSRTACKHCRRARVKCTGELPCDRCKQRHMQCVFIEDGMRTSVNRRVTISGLPSPNSAVCADRVDGQADADDDIDFTELPSQIYDQSVVLPQTDPSALLDLSAVDSSLDSDLAWPWLHENLFLQDGMNLDWYDMSAGAIAEDLSATHTISQDDLSMSHADRHDGHPSIQPSHISRTGDCSDIARTSCIEQVVQIACRISQDSALLTPSSQLQFLFLRDITPLYEQIERVFDLPYAGESHDVEERATNSFQSFLLLYRNNFWPLWPFIPRYGFDHNNFDPLMYLSMVSIGSMYGGQNSSIFGSVLHECLRDELVNPLLDINMPRRSMLPLGQARSLTQAAALYFGQKRAFSYAQHLGGVLVAQARKMEIFTTSPNDVELFSRLQDPSSFVSSWISYESRKRLAFATLRLEMYTSVLHSTRPLVSGEEIELNLPCSHNLWDGSFTSDEAFAAAIRQENNMSGMGISYTDLISISMDPGEKLPHLSMLHLELLMNGLQEKIWSACISKCGLERLSNGEVTGHSIPIDDKVNGNTLVLESTEVPHNTDNSPQSPFIQSLDAHLAWGSRRMKLLRADLQNIAITLRKLRTEVLGVTRLHYPHQGMSQADRSSILSCLLMFHLAFLQLNSPLKLIHQVCHNQLVTSHSGLDKATQRIGDWIESADSTISVRHAVNIYSLLRSETEKPRDTRASVNFLTMTGLYHSAALVWAYTLHCREASHTPQRRDNHVSPGSTIHATDLPRMADFEKVLHDINPAWAGRSSFAVALARLRKADSRPA